MFALAIAASSCSGGGDVSAPIEPTSVPATTITPTTTEPSVDDTTTSAVETTTTTVAPEQTTTTESAPSTTEGVPPNTVYDPTTVEGEIEQALAGTAAAYTQCLQSLPSCDVDTVVESSTGAYKRAVGEALRGWIAEGYNARNVESFSLTVEDVMVTPLESVAVAVACVEDRAVVFQPASGATSEVVIDDPAAWMRVRFQVDKIDEAWFVSASEQLESFSGAEVDGCE